MRKSAKKPRSNAQEKKPSKRNPLEISNFIFRTDQLLLLDLFEDYLWPVFNSEVEAVQGETYGYLFHDVAIGTLSGEVCVYGRLIQRMKLKARQKFFRGKGLQPSNDTLDSDPSSFFILRLYDHKLFLIKEQPRSPNTSKLESLLKEILYLNYHASLKTEKEEFLSKLNRKRFASKEDKDKFESDFRKRHPFPNLSIATIADVSTIDQIIKSFKTIKSFTIKTLQSNNEDYNLDEDLLKKQKEKMIALESTEAEITYKSKTQKGMNQKNTESLISESAKSGGNSTFTIRGLSAGDHPITKTESHAKAKVFVRYSHDTNETSIAKDCFSALEDLKTSNAIQIKTDELIEKLRSKASNLLSRIRRKN